jgi:putative NADH-flavin reductase
MKIAVFGATGGTGRQVVQQALAAGHQVTALARDPSRLAGADPNLTVVAGSVLDEAAVQQTLAGADAAVMALGNTANNPEYVVSQGTQVILDAIGQLDGPRRMVVVSSIGVGDSKDQVPFAFKMLMRTVLRKAMEDKERQEALVKASGLDWIIVRPGGLTDGPATGHYQAGLDPKISAGQVSRADVAAFVLQQLTDDTYLRQAPAIT